MVADDGRPALRMGAIVGRFELMDPIGSGRLGAVWRARDMGTGTFFAIKFISEPPPDVATRLEAEVRAWRWVRQRNLVPITEVLDDVGLVGVVCPLVEGTPLADVLQDGAAMELSEAIPLFRALLDALTTAHAAGRVHGSLCPANVLLEIDEVRINPRLTDAGLAMALGLPVETSPERARYVAPEVGVDGQGGVPADVFALGVILYEMVCGHPPFEDRAIPEGGRLDYAPLERVVPDCPEILARAVDRALAVDPAARYDSVVAFKAAIAPVDRWISDEPTQPFAFDWSEPPVRSSIRTRTLGRENTDSGARPAPVLPVAGAPPASSPAVPPPAPAVPSPDRAPSARVEPPPPRAPAASPPRGPAPPPLPAPVPPPVPSRATPVAAAGPVATPIVVPSTSPSPVVPVSRAPVVIQLAPENVNAADAELVRELGELNADPTPTGRWASFVLRWVAAPVLLLSLLTAIQCWRAGTALHDARAAHARARTEVDADVAAASGYVERLVALGASREVLEPPLLSAQREKEILARSEAVDAFRNLLGTVVRDLPPPSRPEAVLEQRTLQKGIDGLGGNHASHEAAVAALAEAEDMPLSAFADRWGFAAEDPLDEVFARVTGAEER